jgi:hypothetical protein
MGSIEVDPAELLRHAETLDAVAADLKFAPQRLDGLRTGDFGASGVTRALHRFADEWEYGLGRMVESVTFTAEALRVAGWGYAETESTLVETLLEGDW